MKENNKTSFGRLPQRLQNYLRDWVNETDSKTVEMMLEGKKLEDLDGSDLFSLFTFVSKLDTKLMLHGSHRYEMPRV